MAGQSMTGHLEEKYTASKKRVHEPEAKALRVLSVAGAITIISAHSAQAT